MVNRLFAEAATRTFATSYLTILEIASAVKRQESEGDIPKGQAEKTFGSVRVDFKSRFTVFPLDATFVREATTLILSYSLRAPDAIQLASCLEARTLALGAKAVFVSSDNKLNKVATSEGLIVFDPTAADADKKLDSILSR